MARMRRWAWWTAAALCMAAGIGLVAVAVVADLGTADQLAGVSGGIAALVGLAFTVRGLFQERTAGMPAGTGGQPDDNGAAADPAALDRLAGAVREVRVQAEDGGIGAGGSITSAGAASAPGPALEGGTAPPRIDKRDIRATGPGSVAAGGDIAGIGLNGHWS
ncbi:hypothetical protein ABZ725_48915 [Streptomyces sp. NPDC006872]|uniref:hypothetical protein n=1 Tax=Streptomyces sp. NPDC006872 TaxID=3155720 RepID=UPI0033EEF8D8